jgi:hypothetical protein
VIRSFVFLAILSLVLCGTATAKDASALNGEMSPLQYLIGNWGCSVVVMTGPNTTATQQGNLTFALAPDNTLSQTIYSPPYAANAFIGYVAQIKQYFLASTDNGGGSSTEMATMGSGHTIVFTGSGFFQGKTVSLRDTEEKISDTQIHSISEMQMNGKWVTAANATCTKR